MLAHVVGYMSEISPDELKKSPGRYRRGDFIGRRGIERSWEKVLRGVDGRRFIAVDARGNELDRSVEEELIPESERRLPSTPGHNLVLSLDLGLQTVAQKALEENAKAGGVVVVDIHTGGVLALVSSPSYDPNMMTGRISRQALRDLVGDKMQPLFARATQQHYHPGSTFKVVTALAGLEAGLVNPQSATSCSGGYNLGPRRWRCHKDSGHGGGINLRRSLILSCDSYYYWLSDRLGLDPIAEMATRLGFGARSGIELAPEAPGLMPTVAFHERVDKGYAKGYALNAAIGQGSVNVTVLQLAMAYAAIANGGTLYRPHLVRRVEDVEGRLVQEVKPEVVRELGIKPAHLAAVMDGLKAVVAEPGGTAYSKRLSDITVAGKTGTAQNVVIGKRRLKETEMSWEERDHAWFAAVAPADAPEIAIAVINEHGGHGGAAAAPIAMAVIQGYFDLKSREAAGQPLSAQEVAALVPEARFAVGSKPKTDEATAAPGHEGAWHRGEPLSAPEEVAEPERLEPSPKAEAEPRAADVEAVPSPE
jgi:penicillin-binding protein 2